MKPRTKSASKKRKLARITAWIPEDDLDFLVSASKKKRSRSEVLRDLVDGEVERQKSAKAHRSLYAIAGEKDFDVRLL